MLPSCLRLVTLREDFAILAYDILHEELTRDACCRVIVGDLLDQVLAADRGASGLSLLQVARLPVFVHL